MFYDQIPGWRRRSDQAGRKTLETRTRGPRTERRSKGSKRLNERAEWEAVVVRGCRM